ncbi:MAG: hypothetical protein DMF50_11470, partial [Acidobacteria bacterium]
MAALFTVLVCAVTSPQAVDRGGGAGSGTAHPSKTPARGERGSTRRAPPAGRDATSALLVKLRVPPTRAILNVLSSRYGARVTYAWPEINAVALRVSRAKQAALAGDPQVLAVEPDARGDAFGGGPASAANATAPPMTVVPIGTADRPIESWNLDMADVTGTGYQGTGVTVAVVDSGLPQNWPDFLPPDRVDTTHAAGFGSEGSGDFHNPVNAITGVGGHIGLFPHGLAVSSVIVGFPSDLGPVQGAAPRATILPIRVLNQFNFGYFSWFTAGILHVANLKRDGALTGPVVINFSIQARSDSQVLRAAIDYAISQGVLFVTIAGNFGPDPGTVSFPGRLPESITAGAAGWIQEGSSPDWFLGDVPENDPSQVYVASFSGREGGPAGSGVIDVLAPGSFVFGEWLFGPGFSEGREVAFDAVDNFIFGTSFAAPHVTGIVAQLLEQNPFLTQDQAERTLKNTALPIPPAPAGVQTPVEPIAPWFSDATGSGLARGDAALAAGRI